MARGYPALLGAFVGLPIVGIGAYVYLADTGFSPLLGLPFVVFGGFVILLGVYVQVIAAPREPSMRQGESVIEIRHPTQRVAFVYILLGVPTLLLAAYLFFETTYPFVYPTLALVLSLYALSSGLQTYWSNSLTTYYLTNQRVIREYRFISLSRREVPLGKVRGVEESRSFIETFVGLGNVRISSGGGRRLSIVAANIRRPRAFADQVRKQLG
jgi:hypothetical protein